MNTAAYLFLAELRWKISVVSSDDRESSFLFQRISVLIQRYNAILLHESFTEENRPRPDQSTAIRVIIFSITDYYFLRWLLPKVKILKK